MRWLRYFLLGSCAALASCQSMPASTPELKGVWRLDSLTGESLAPGSRAHLEFSEPPRLTGNAGCNRFFGLYHREGQALSVQPSIGVGKIQCQPRLMAQEYQLLALLPRVVTARWNQNRLTLYDADGEQLLTAQRMKRP